MPTYAELQEQIKELQKQADEAKKQEFQGVVKELKEKISLYGITAKDLGFSDKLKDDAKNNKEPKDKIPPVYRSPDGTKEWNKRGPKPKWVQEWIDKGNDITDLLIEKP